MKQYVLIVDDEVDFTFLMKKNLEATGAYDVAVCNDGLQAVDRAKQQRPNVILLDIMMPGKPGEEIAKELGQFKETAGIPVIFLTALVKGQETAERGHVIGGLTFVAKPVKIKELIAVIERVTKTPGSASNRPAKS